MAYLPAAGVRLMTSHKQIDFVYGREVPNIFHCADRRQIPCRQCTKRGPPLFDMCELPPLSVRAEDWEIPQDTDFVNRSRPQDPMCSIPEPIDFMANDYGRYDERAKRLSAIEAKRTPASDVRIKYDQQSRWQNEAMKVFAISHQWEKLYGKKYFYQV